MTSTTSSFAFEALCQEVNCLNEVSLFKRVSAEKVPEKKMFLLTGPETADEVRSQVQVYLCHSSAASRNFEKGARSHRHFQKAGQPEYFWATHPFNAKHPFNIYLCITILQEAFTYYNKFLVSQKHF